MSLELKGVTKYYGFRFGKEKVLDNINVILKPGEIVGVLGANGAGKTTLMKTILGYVPVDYGEILLDGEKITTDRLGRLSFATSEHSYFGKLTATEHQKFYEMQFPKFRQDRFESLMNFFELPQKKAIRTLSTGQKNQFEVVLALSQGADYILMDEPFAGNDIFNREDFYKVLLGILEPMECVLISTHLIEEMKNFFGRVLMLQKGKLIQDISIEELEEQGVDLVDYMKQCYSYENNRVLKTIESLSKGE